MLRRRQHLPPATSTNSPPKRTCRRRRRWATSTAAAASYLTHPVFNTHHSEHEPHSATSGNDCRTSDLSLDAQHDPARLVHDEAQRRQRRCCRCRGPQFAELHPYTPADTDGRATTSCFCGSCKIGSAEITGFAAGLASAERGQPGRVRRACWRSAATTIRRADGGPRRLPHPRLRPRHQPRLRRHRRHDRVVVVKTAGRTATSDLDDLVGRSADANDGRSTRGANGDVSQSTHGVFERADPRRCAAAVHDRRRAGLPRRREHERAGRSLPAGRLRRGRGATLTSTRRSASPTAAAGRAWDRSVRGGAPARRSCRADPRDPDSWRGQRVPRSARPSHPADQRGCISP